MTIGDGIGSGPTIDYRRGVTTQTPSPPKPWLCWVLLGLNVATWLAMVIAGVDPSSPSSADLVAWGGNLGLMTVQGEWWRLLTAMFLHGGLLHLAFNGYFLWAIGRVTEQVFGSLAFALIYFGSGLLASTTSLLWQPEAISVGASGALFGVFGAFLGFTLRRREVLPPTFVKSVYRNAVILIVLNLAIGLGVENIDLAAHLGGLVAGLWIGWLIAWLAEPRAQPQDPAARRRRAIGITTLATSGVLAAGLLAVPRWDDLYGTLARYDAIESEAIAAYDAAQTPEQRLRVLRDDTLPAMDELDALLAELDTLPERALDHVEDLRAYTQTRREALAAELASLERDQSR